MSTNNIKSKLIFKKKQNSFMLCLHKQYLIFCKWSLVEIKCMHTSTSPTLAKVYIWFWPPFDWITSFLTSQYSLFGYRWRKVLCLRLTLSMLCITLLISSFLLCLVSALTLLDSILICFCLASFYFWKVRYKF